MRRIVVLEAWLLVVLHVITIDKVLSDRFQIEPFREIYNNGYLTFDARLSYSINYSKNHQQQIAKLSIVGKNISNQIYTQRPGVLQPPTNISIRLESSF